MTLTSAILGIRGSGKTNTAVVFTEELLEQNQQIIIIDPLNVWWGLKSSASGDEAGYPILVMGGPQGDIPLTVEDAEVMATFLAENRTSAILSLRHLRKGEQTRFVATFAEIFYQKKGEPGLGTPVLVVIDEASTFVPQSFQGDSARCVGAIEDLVRKGRASGLGVMLIDQRAASVNKDVLTQLELLVAHRHTSPQDQAALKLWVKAHDTGGQEKNFLNSLASLELGTAWFWSPGWLNIFELVKVRHRRTFDSSATPKLGQTIAAPTALASLDLDALKEKLNQSVSEAKANDPAVLKKRIDELQAELATRPTLSPELIEQFEAAAHDMVAIGKDVFTVGRSLLVQLEGFKPANARGIDEETLRLPSTVDIQLAPKSSDPSPAKPRSAEPTPTPPKSSQKTQKIDLNLPDGQQRILDALLIYKNLGLDGVHKDNLAVGARQSPKSSQYSAHLKALKEANLIFSPVAKMWQLTVRGAAAARETSTIKTLADLHREWLSKFDSLQRDALQCLINHYPESIHRDELADEIGQSRNSSLLGANLSGLKEWGLVEYPSRGYAQAASILFPSGLK
jgi:hypothetical protein